MAAPARMDLWCQGQAGCQLNDSDTVLKREKVMMTLRALGFLLWAFCLGETLHERASMIILLMRLSPAGPMARLSPLTPASHLFFVSKGPGGGSACDHRILVQLARVSQSTLKGHLLLHKDCSR